MKYAKMTQTFTDGLSTTVLFAERPCLWGYERPILTDGGGPVFKIDAPRFYLDPRISNGRGQPVSSHRGGMVVGMADGSVRSMPISLADATIPRPNGTTMLLFDALISPNGREGNADW